MQYSCSLPPRLHSRPLHYFLPPQGEKQAQSSSNSPLLSAVHFFSLSMWNELCNFVFFFVFSVRLLIFFLACEFILLSVALSVQWHIRKDEICSFFYIKKRNVFFNVCKSRVECWKSIYMTRWKDIFPPLPKWYAKSPFFSIFWNACLMARVSMFLCFPQQNL